MNKIETENLHDIFQNIIAGDETAIEELYKGYKSLIMNIVFSMVKNRDLSEEIAQIVFMKIIKIEKNKLPTSYESSWLYTVTKNQTIEYLRKEHNIPGGEISIGLWIGSSMTPNYLSDAADKLNESDKNSSSVECDPMQVTTCPWCGAQIERSCYSIEDSMIIKCNNNKNCRFHDGLPIYLIDEDIYKKKPTLLLSTVDKFARLVWEENSKVLFGDGKTLPPELILQDELHLISGPLGSIDGIYELAIEKLCTKKGFKPKYIASTATVRNAANQIKSLYDKDMFQFPPNGISVDDSFFAI